jgi:ribosomal protein L23
LQGRKTNMAKIVNPRDIIIAPVVSEKSYGLMEQNTYTFYVAKDSNKNQIKNAVEEIFGVQVASVNTLNREGKRKRTRTGFGRRKATKRAYVTLREGSDSIDIFGANA